LTAFLEFVKRRTRVRFRYLLDRYNLITAWFGPEHPSSSRTQGQPQNKKCLFQVAD